MEIILIFISSIIYLLFSDEGNSATSIALCFLSLAIPLREFIKLYRENTKLEYPIIHILTDPLIFYLFILSISYTISISTLTLLPQELVEFGIQKPNLYNEFKLHLSEAALCVSLSVPLISLFYQFGLRANTYKLAYLKKKLTNINQAGFNINIIFTSFLLIYILSQVIRIILFFSGRIHFESEVSAADIFGPFGSLVSIILAFCHYIPAICVVSHHDVKENRFLIFALISFLLELLYSIVFSVKSGIFFPFLYLTYAYIFSYRKLPRKTVFIPLTIIVCLGIQLAALSRFASSEIMQISANSPIEFSGEVLQLLFSTMFQDNSQLSSQTVAKSEDSAYYLSRFNIAIPLLGAIDYVKIHGSKLDIGPYFNFIFTIFPSFLFPVKPAPFAANVFGRDTKIISPYDFDTSIRPSILGNFYYSFGFAGVIFMSIFVGLLMSFFVRLVKNRNFPLNKLAYLFITISILDVENAFSNSFGSLFKNVLLVWIIGKIAVKSK